MARTGPFDFASCQKLHETVDFDIATDSQCICGSIHSVKKSLNCAQLTACGCCSTRNFAITVGNNYAKALGLRLRVELHHFVPQAPGLMLPSGSEKV